MKLALKLSIALMTAVSCAFAACPFVIVLGTGQDAGVPQMGCNTPFCKSAWENAARRQMVSSIALVDPDSGRRWIFDATPDIPEQFELLRKSTLDRSARIDGIFITHAHIGHYTGLMYLGRESMNTKDVPVYAMPRMTQMLQTNAPWSQLVELKNIELRSLADNGPIELRNDLSVTPFLVPHRDELSETVGFRIRSKAKTIVFIPDIDKWEKWKTPLVDVVKSADHVLVDGTFFAGGEISRPVSEVPHPFVTETKELLKGLSPEDRAKVIFTHFNHSNPLVQGNARKIAQVRRAGFKIAQTGMRFIL